MHGRVKFEWLLKAVFYLVKLASPAIRWLGDVMERLMLR